MSQPFVHREAPFCKLSGWHHDTLPLQLAELLMSECETSHGAWHTDGF